MAITIDYSDQTTPEYVINIPRTDMTLVQSSPTEIRELDIDTLRTTLNDLMDDPEGMPYPTNHVHTAPLTVAGITLARVVEILDPYVIQFEDGQYNVNVTGGNSNISDVVVKNQVGVNTANSGGLIEVAVAGVAPEDIWNYVIGDSTTAGQLLLDINRALLRNSTIVEETDGSNTVTIFESDGTTIAVQLTVSSDGRVRTRV